MRPDYFIRYPLATKLLSRMHELVFESPRARPEGLLLVSDSNNGKSHILKRFCADVAKTAVLNHQECRVPVIYLQAPVNGIRRDLFSSLATALCVPEVYRMAAMGLRKRILNALSEAGTLTICVDELHHILPGGPARQRVILDDLKFISNELQIPIFLAGTYHAFSLIARDEQYSSRFPSVLLPRWDLSRDYLSLLASIEQALECPKGSFTNHANAELVWKHSRGLIGRIWGLCLKAHALSRLGPTGRITEAEINAAGFADFPWMDTAEKGN